MKPVNTLRLNPTDPVGLITRPEVNTAPRAWRRPGRPGRPGKPGKPSGPRRSARAGRAFVYLAVARDEAGGRSGRFKIGVAADVPQRMLGLPEGLHIDWAASRQRALPSHRRALQVESSLHKALAPMRVHPGHHGTGYTEWFDIAALGLACTLLDNLPDEYAAWPRCLPAQGHQPEPSRRPVPLRQPVRSHEPSPQRPPLPRRPRTDARRWREPDPGTLSVILPDLAPGPLASNLDRIRRAAQCWAQLAQAGALQVCPERGDRPARLVLPGLREGLLPAGHGQRLRLMGTDGLYDLNAPASRPDAPRSLVRTIEFAGPQDQDLVIQLQPSRALKALPSGRALAYTLRAELRALAELVQARREAGPSALRPMVAPPAAADSSSTPGPEGAA